MDQRSRGSEIVKAQGNSRSGGRILVDQLQRQGVERLTCVPGESFLAVLGRAARCRDRRAGLPAGRWCGDHGGSVRQAHRPSRHLLRHARPRFDERRTRRAHCRTGFHADDHVHRSGRTRHARARGVSGAGLQGGVRLDRQMGRRNRQRRTHSRTRRARLPRRDAGQAGSGGDLAAGRHSRPRWPMWSTRRASSPRIPRRRMPT